MNAAVFTSVIGVAVDIPRIGRTAHTFAKKRNGRYELVSIICIEFDGGRV